MPKQIYYGTTGRLQSFLDSFSHSLFPDAYSKYFDGIKKQNILKLCNIARNFALCDMRKNLVVRKMNWYVEKIINMITENKCDYDGYCIFLRASVLFNGNIYFRKK